MDPHDALWAMAIVAPHVFLLVIAHGSIDNMCIIKVVKWFPSEVTKRQGCTTFFLPTPNWKIVYD